MKTYLSEHYVFHYQADSAAERDIAGIAKEQEQCFQRICAVLEVNYPEKIHYYLLDSAEEVGRLFGSSEPINGFAIWGENKIYSVYNEEIKCIGAHEDVHLISFLINTPKSEFIVEGLAMFFDETWWGLDNEIWAAYYKHRDSTISIEKMIACGNFYDIDCMVSYPIAGAFTKYLVESFGIQKYIELYKVTVEPYQEAFERIFTRPIVEIETEFWVLMSKVAFDIASVEACLEQ